MTGKDSDKDGTNAGHQNQGQDMTRWRTWPTSRR